MTECHAFQDDLIEMLTVRAEAGLETQPPLFRLLRNAAQAGSATLFRDHMHQVIGYAIWAKVSAETAARFVRTGMAPYYFYEWREGGIFLLLDVVIYRHASRPGRRQLMAVLAEHRAVMVARRDRVRLYFKNNLMRWRRPATGHSPA